ncbi:hypothetical protein [Streptomyces sp. NPDC003401]
MRGLPVRPTAFSALCATLVLGFAAPSALAADGVATRERAHAVPSASLPGAEALLARARSLDHIEPALAPVTDLLATSLRTGGHRADADRAKRLRAAAEDALTRVARSAGPTGGPPAVRAGSRTPSRSADVTDDVLAAVDTRLDALIEAVASGDADQILPASTKLVTGLSELVTSLTDGLSLPDLEALSALEDLSALEGLEDLEDPEDLTDPEDLAETPAPPAEEGSAALPALPVTPSTLPAPASPPASGAPAPGA